MKLKNKFIFYLLFAGILVTACSKSSPDEEEAQFAYLQSDELLMPIQQNFAKILFAGLAGQYGEAQGMAAEVKSNAMVYKITYKTTFEGEGLLASGLVCVPGQIGNYPVLCFQNGTNVEYKEAPSKNPTRDLFQVLESVSAMGFVVVIPDYPGFGESEQVFHPYLEKDNTVPSLVDILKAALEFTGQEKIGAKLNGDLYLMGYSQGGWASLQLQREIEQNGLDGFELQASSCGAGPYQLTALSSLIAHQDSYPMPYFLAYMMYAYQLHGEFTNPLDEIFANEYAAKIPGLFNGTNTGAEINAGLTTQVGNLLQAGFRTGFQSAAQYQPIREALVRNSVAAWDVATPTRLYHGDADTFVPVEMSVQMKAGFSALGVSDGRVKLQLLAGKDHQSGVLPFGLSSLKWFLELENN